MLKWPSVYEKFGIDDNMVYFNIMRKIMDQDETTFILMVRYQRILYWGGSEKRDIHLDINI